MIPQKKLSDNLSIPVIGFGTWKLKGSEGQKAVEDALSVGYRHIDTADRYGNHKEVGEAIKNSGVKREELFVTTKVWYDRLHREDVLVDVDRFLAELQLDYIDLLLIHWPNKGIPVSETLKPMEECKVAGKIKAIGVSNFTIGHLEEAKAVGVEIVNNQIELHPSFDQLEMRHYCAVNNISVTAYSPLRSGDLDLPLMQELAGKYGKSPAQIILNWIINRDLIVLPQSTDPSRMKENLEASQFTLSDEDLVLIDGIPDGERYNDPDFGEFDFNCA